MSRLVGPGAGLAAAFLGGPITGIGAAVFLELGQVTLELANKKHEINKFRRNHELAYIIDTSKRLVN